MIHNLLINLSRQKYYSEQYLLVDDDQKKIFFFLFVPSRQNPGYALKSCWYRLTRVNGKLVILEMLSNRTVVKLGGTKREGEIVGNYACFVVF